MNTRYVVSTVLVSCLIIIGCAAPAAPAGDAGMDSTAAVTSPLSIASNATVILVIDDFAYIELADLKDYDLNVPTDTSENCVVTPDGQLDSAKRGVAISSNVVHNIPHGEMVYERLDSLLRSYYGDPSQVSDGTTLFGLSWMKQIHIWNDTFILVAVDTVGYTTSLVTSRIEQSINVWENPAEYGVQNFVLNMSFAVIPCDLSLGKNPDELLAEYESQIGDDPELEQLRDTLSALADEGITEAELEELIFEPTFRQLRLSLVYGMGPAVDQTYYQTIIAGNDQDGNPDPLANLLTQLSKESESRHVISVAAAGNYEWNVPFPFAPAIWPGVISVSAGDDGADPPLAWYSNYGEVRMSGAYTLSTGPTVEGTSFAAPELSYWAAEYLTAAGTSSCLGPDGTTYHPALNYTDTPDGLWDNLSLVEADNFICPNFIP
ncbi:MAG: hypothetical protein DCC55_38235 [Chloroflexi bacterium]|nr:MAG: hypothetical protein DCC55_38235 [Chloroflexota bacterium]